MSGGILTTLMLGASIGTMQTSASEKEPTLYILGQGNEIPKKDTTKEQKAEEEKSKEKTDDKKEENPKEKTDKGRQTSTFNPFAFGTFKPTSNTRQGNKKVEVEKEEEKKEEKKKIKILLK